MISDPTGGQSYGFVSGRVTSVVVDQNDPSGNTVYVGGAYGGVWKSTNAAAADPTSVVWTPLIEGQPTLAVGAIALKPNDSNVILIGTGETHSSADSYYGLGILRSTDGGQTWNLIRSSQNSSDFTGLGFSKIAFSTDNPNLVVAAAANTNFEWVMVGGRSLPVGAYYSTDAGLTWYSAPTPFGNQSVTSVVYNAAAHKFFAAVRSSGFYSSPDGVTWTRLSSQPGGSTLSGSSCPGFSCPIYRGEMAVKPGANEMFAWYVDANESNRGIFRSQDGGNSWAAISVIGINACGDQFGCGTPQGVYDLYLAAVPASGGTDLYAGSINLFKCSITAANLTCGVAGSWKNLTHVYGCTPLSALAHVHPDQQAIDFSYANPSVIYFGNDGGVYRTLNGPGLNTGACSGHNPFDNLNGTLGSITEFVSFSQHSTDDTTLLGGTQDNGSPATDASRSGSNQTTWSAVNLGDGGFNEINPSSPNEWFTANIDVSIQRCTNGAACTVDNFLPVVTNDTVGGDHGSFYTPYILDPQASDKLIVGTCRVWRGPSGGGWNSSNALSYSFDSGTAATCTGGEFHLVRSLAAGGPVTALGSQVVYAGTEGGRIFVTTNADAGASSWQLTFVASNQVSDIAIDPSDPSGFSAYATLMDFGPIGHVYRTTDAGAHWTNINGDPANLGLADAPANSVLVDPDDPSIVYAGTDVGVFFTNDNGAHWYEYGPEGGPGALPNVPVTRLRAFTSGSIRKLRISTYGRGVWETDLLGSLAPDFVIGVPKPDVTAYAGQPVNFAGVLTALNGYVSPVTLSCVNGSTAPPATCSGGTITPAGPGQDFTIPVSNPTPGEFGFKVQGTGSDPGNKSHALPLTLQVVDFGLTPPSPDSLHVQRGVPSAPIALQVTAGGNFSGAVTLRCNPATLPSGTWCSFAPAPPFGPTASSPANVTLTIYTSSYTPVGVASVVLEALVTGAPVRQRTVTLTVDLNQDFSIYPGFQIPGARGQLNSGNIQVLAVDGYTGTVSLSCSVVPATPTCSLAQASVSTFPATVLLTMDPKDAPIGSYQVTINGTDGTTTHTGTTTYWIGDYTLDVSYPVTPYANSGATTGAVRVWIQGNPSYGGRVSVTCDSSSIPGSTCANLGPLTAGMATFAQLTVPAGIKNGTYPLVFHSQDADFGTPSHDATAQVTIQDFSIQRGNNTTRTAFAGQASQSYDLTLVPGSGFSSTVTFSCGGVVSCTFSPSSITPSSAPVSLTATAVGSPAGNYNFYVYGTANGAAKPSAGQLSLVVQDFSVTPSSYQNTVLAGSSVQLTVNVTGQNGFAGTVSLSCTSPPAGVTCSFSPSAVSPGQTSTLTISASSSVTSNFYGYPLTIAGSATSPAGAVSRTVGTTLYVKNFQLQGNGVIATVLPGGAATYNVGVINGSPPVLITYGCSNLPAGTSCSANPAQTTGGSQITVTTTAGVTPVNTTNFGITGTSGDLVQSIQVNLQVADFSFTSSTASLSMNAGSSANLTVTVKALNGFNGAVTLGCYYPSPFTCTFTPWQVTPTSTGTNSSVSIAVSANQPGGVYSVPLIASVDSVQKIIPITVTVRSFHVDLQPTQQVIPAGTTSTTLNIKVFADQGFSNGVGVFCSSTATCSLSPISVVPTAAGAVSTATVTVPGTQAPGPRAVTISASSGQISVSKQATVYAGADFSVTPQSPISRTIQQASTATYQLEFSAINGFNAPVNFSCSGLPAGASCQFSANPLTPAAGSQPMQVTVNTTLASLPGTYDFTVTGTGAGLTHSASPVPRLVIDSLPDFVLSSPAATQDVRPGQTATYSASVNRNGTFASVVNMSCVGQMPAGASCGVNPTSVDLSAVQSANVTILVPTTNGTTPLGTTSFNLHGAEQGGSKQHDLPLTLIASDFHLSAPTSASVPQAQSAQYTVTVFADQGFSQAVTLSCQNLPANIGPCSFSQNNFVPSGSGTAVTLSVPVGAGAIAPADYTFDVVATGGSVSHAVTESLYVDLVQDFALTGGTIARTVVPGTTGNFTATLTPLNSFSASMTLTCSGLPTGAACVFTPASGVAIGSGTPQPLAIDITTNGTSTPVGTSNVTVTASGGGKTHTVGLTLTVQDFTLSLSPTSRTVAVGAGTTYTVTLAAQNGFSTPVTLSCPGAPVGVTCSFAPNPAGPAGTSTATVQTASNITVGTKMVPISGTATPNGTPRTKSQNATLIVSATTPSFTLTSTALTKTAVRGASTTYTVTVKSTTTTSPGTVTLSCVTPLPTGVTCSFSPASVSPTTLGVNSTATLTTNVNTSTAGTNPIVFKGTTTTQLRQLNATLNIADFSVGVSPSSQTISAVGGGTASYTVTLTALGGVTFPSAVTLSCPTPPTGVSCTNGFAPASVTPTGAGATSTLTLTTTGAAASGPINFSVQGASGTLLRSQTVEVINGLDFTLNASVNPVTVNLGSTNTTTLSATVVGGFASAITLSCTTLSPTPASGSLTCSGFSPSNVFTPPGGFSDITLSATSNLTPGVYTQTVSGTGGGITHTTNVTVNVPDFSVGLTGGSSTVFRGANLGLNGTATSIAGYSSSVPFSCSTGDANAPCVASTPVTPTGVGAAVTVTVSPNGSATTGLHTVTLTGDDGAGHVHSGTFDITVQEFAVAATDANLSTEAGAASGTYSGSVTGSSFTGNVALSCSSPSITVTCAFSPSASIAAAGGGGTPYTFTITPDPAATVGGPYVVTITGTVGSVTRTATVHITVLATQDWSYSYHLATPQSQTVNAGQSASYDLDLSPNNGFASSVALGCTITGAPAGLGCSITGSPLTPPGTITLNLTTTTGTVAAGTYSIVVSGTGGGKTRNTTASLTVRDFSLSVTPPTQTIQSGTDANYNVSLATSSSFPSSPDLTCAVLTTPAGTSCDFDATPLSPSGSTTLHAHSIGGTTPDGSYTLRSTATSGSTVHTADVTYVVSSSDFTLTTSTPSKTVPRNSLAFYLLTFTPTGSFNATVTVTCSGVPANVTCTPPPSFTLTSPTAAPKTVTVRPALTAIPGTYQFQINATGGSKSHSITVTLIVT